MPDIRIMFRTGKDYRVVPVSGVYGGITPQGMVHADLFVEKKDLPESMVMRVEEASGSSYEVSREPEQSGVVREMLVGMVMRPEVAKAIGQWLIHQVEQMEKQMTSSVWKQ
jgi:hypothetical protein